MEQSSTKAYKLNRDENTLGESHKLMRQSQGAEEERRKKRQEAATSFVNCRCGHVLYSTGVILFPVTFRNLPEACSIKLAVCRIFTLY